MACFFSNLWMIAYILFFIGILVGYDVGYRIAGCSRGLNHLLILVAS